MEVLVCNQVYRGEIPIVGYLIRWKSSLVSMVTVTLAVAQP